MTQPLPPKLNRAEVRIAGNKVSVSTHGLMIPTEIGVSMAAAMWDQLGAKPGQVSVTVQGIAAGAELIRLSDRSRGMRVWIGTISFRRPLLDRYWDALYTMEISERGLHLEMDTEVADVA